MEFYTVLKWKLPMHNLMVLISLGMNLLLMEQGMLCRRHSLIPTEIRRIRSDDEETVDGYTVVP